MGKRGPKSAAEHSAVVVIDVDRLRLQPPAYLTGPGKKVFCEIISASDPKAFRKAEAPLLACYAEALVAVRHYAHAMQTEEGHGFSHKP